MDDRHSARFRFDGDAAAEGAIDGDSEIAEGHRVAGDAGKRAGDAAVDDEQEQSYQIADEHVIAKLLAFAEEGDLALGARFTDKAIRAVGVVSIAGAVNSARAEDGERDLGG